MDSTARLQIYNEYTNWKNSYPEQYKEMLTNFPCSIKQLNKEPHNETNPKGFYTKLLHASPIGGYST
jgi:hypothetical protein